MNKFLRSVVEILLDEQGILSVGRVLLFSIFVLSMFRWARGLSIDSSTLTVLLALMGYVLSSKMIGSITDKKDI